MRPRGADTGVPGRHLLDEVAKLRQLRAQRVVHVDEVLAGRLLLRGVGAVGLRRRPGRSGRLVPGALDAEPGAVVRRGDDVEVRRGRAGPHLDPWRRRRGLVGPRRAHPLGGHELADAGRHLRGEPADVVGVVAREHVRAHALGEGELGQLLDPHGRRALEGSPPVAAEVAVHVVEPANVSGVAAGVRRGGVDRGVHRGQRVEADVAEAGQPAVRMGAGEPQHARLDGAEPDLDVVSRARAGVRSVHAVVLAVLADRPSATLVPHRTHDPQRLLERVDPLRRSEGGATDGRDRLGEATGA